jgi:light-regulated signal transduction histidine kinase (bacteriophytochrome)
MGHAWLDLVHPDDVADMARQWREASKTGQAYTGTRRLRARDGNYHTMSYRSSPVFNNNGELLFWVGIDIDITELKAVETALRISNSELETFSYSVSHDLRAPLNTVDGFSRLLAKELGVAQSARTTHYLSRIQAGVTQMGQLIEGLLSLAHVTRQALRFEPVDLSQLAREVLDSLRVHSPSRQADVSVAPGLTAHGDTRLLRAVMENLLGNAWKFSERRERTVIEVGWSAEQQAYFVRDNGAGFDMAYADKLFGTFQRLHGATEFAGTGIGLATVARVIARHGGRIWAESAPDQGATFFFVLPGG